MFLLAMKLLKRGGNGVSQRDPPPPPFPFLALEPTLRITFSTLPNLPLSKNQRRGYNNANMNKLSPTQNTPALQAN